MTKKWLRHYMGILIMSFFCVSVVLPVAIASISGIAYGCYYYGGMIVRKLSTISWLFAICFCSAWLIVFILLTITNKDVWRRRRNEKI